MKVSQRSSAWLEILFFFHFRLIQQFDWNFHIFNISDFTQPQKEYLQPSISHKKTKHHHAKFRLFRGKN